MLVHVNLLKQGGVEGGLLQPHAIGSVTVALCISLELYHSSHGNAVLSGA